MGSGRTLHVRCTTWEQVEVFYTRKLRRGKLLSMRVPFQTAVGSQVTLGLELPNEMVIAIEGTVRKSSEIEGGDASGGDGKGGRTWIEVEFSGFTDEVVARIKAMAAGAAPAPEPAARRPKRASAIPTDELPVDERALFHHLTAELRRIRQASVTDVLGVTADADAFAIRRSWMDLMRRHHPDLVARRHAPAISHLAEELTILCNRAYDRLRATLVADGRATAVGSAINPPSGWLIGFDDMASTSRSVDELAAASSTEQRSQARSKQADGDSFESRARAMLRDGSADEAQEVLAAALVVYPRNRPLRSLYYMASAISALLKGELMLATSQLEAAIAHHEQCTEASALLDHVHQFGTSDAKLKDAVRRIFQ
ncbi:MAG: DnaJ family molecular chaperone [Kofleriaceae bacterium]